MQLNIEQKRLISSKPNGHMLIKGVAGSGKTTVAVHKIPFLLNHYCFADDDSILMITFNKTLVFYLNYLYNKIEQDEIQMTFDALISNRDKVTIKSIDSIIYEFFTEWKMKNSKNLNLISDKNLMYNILNQSIAELQKIYPNVKLLDQKYNSFLLDEIEWIKACNYLDEAEYQSADRLGRTSKQLNDSPQRIMKNSETRKAIYELMLLYNKKLNDMNYIDFKDMALIVLDYLKTIKNYKKYTHIIIDESQDLTKVQLDIINLLYCKKPYSSITFIADTAQSIYNHSWLVKGRSFTSIGYDMTGKSNQLSKNYRTTVQIAQCAYSLIENDPNIIEDENFVKPSLIDKQGLYPVFKIFKTLKDEADFIAKEINNLSKEYNYRDIAIICKTKKYLDTMFEYIKEFNIPATFLNRDNPQFEEDSVKFLTMHSIKGLEFKVVFVVGLNKKIIPNIDFSDLLEPDIQESIERKLLYVGMTRANEILYLTSSEVPSKFISDINPSFLKLGFHCLIKSFYKVPLENYLFKDKIINIYSKEEMIRQWIIKELMETYKYPLELIDIEYKINSFSKVGSVDVVVFIYKNNKKIPFIFFEVKAYNSMNDFAFEQLKSYLNCSNCFYGVLTDGNNFIVIDKNGNNLDDIPCFDISMLPSNIEEYQYIDLKHNKSFAIKRNIKEPLEISISNNGTDCNLDLENALRLDIYSKIAAGSPTYISSEKVGEFILPKDIFPPYHQYFILKVKGDSMIEAGIEDGDMVIIQNCNSAQNRDIVAVSIGEEATLKRFMRLGGDVLLVPENPNYEPIHIKDDQARIIGVAIGILKKKA